jgi:hypothetical protein
VSMTVCADMIRTARAALVAHMQTTQGVGRD